MFGVHDGSDDVATECGTNLIEQVIEVLAALLVVVVAYLEFGTVGCQAAGERRRDARTEVASDYGCAHECYLRMLFLEEVYEYVGVRCRCIGEESLGVEHEKLIYAVRQNLAFHFILDACTCHDGVEFHAELVCKLASLGEKFL